jgi:hypothetical protein
VGGIAPVALGMLTCGGTLSTSPQSQTFVGLPGLVRVRTEGTFTFDDAYAPPPPPLCPPTPVACRTPVAAGKASLQMRADEGDKDSLQWRWRRGAATSAADFEDPVNTDHYDLCVYDQSGLLTRIPFPAGRSCDGKPCWRAKPSGFAYKNPDTSQQAATQLDLKAGASGKAAITLKARGPYLDLPDLGALSGAVEVRLHQAGSGVCWGASFSAPFDKLDIARGAFKDRSE